MDTETDRRLPGARGLASKVPEVTLWFWIIKILCTTVGESFADHINSTLGVGLVNTSLVFTAVLVVVLAVQLRLPRYVPLVYWLTVVVLSVTGTLYILTDERGVPLGLSTSVFTTVLAVVCGIWFARERTLSIHSIVTLPRVKDLKTAWDDDQSRLKPLDAQAWDALDGEVDAVLTAVRAGSPDPATETRVLQTLLPSLT